MKRKSISTPGEPLSLKELIEQIEIARKTSKKYSSEEAKKILRM